MGFSKPDDGGCFIKGLKCNRNQAEIMKSVGYLPGEIALPENLTGEKFVDMMAGLRVCQNKEYVKELCKTFELDLRGKTKRMSLGNKRKLALVTAFMADPEVLILDEPTSGLDPIMQEQFIKFLKKEQARGKTILLSSHIFSEVDAVCDRIVIVKDGKIVSAVKADDIRHNQNKLFVLRFGNAKSVNKFRNERGITVTCPNPEQHIAEVAICDKDINNLIRIASGYNIENFWERKFTLESYFMHFYEKEQK
jgi:ABC-2 type transport system ATP-binding protein